MPTETNFLQVVEYQRFLWDDFTERLVEYRCLVAEMSAVQAQKNLTAKRLGMLRRLLRAARPNLELA